MFSEILDERVGVEVWIDIGEIGKLKFNKEDYLRKEISELEMSRVCMMIMKIIFDRIFGCLWGWWRRYSWREMIKLGRGGFWILFLKC